MAPWGGDNGSCQSGSNLSTWLVIGAVLAAILCCMMITDDDGGGGLGGGHGGITFGGFGGK